MLTNYKTKDINLLYRVLNALFSELYNKLINATQVYCFTSVSVTLTSQPSQRRVLSDCACQEKETSFDVVSLNNTMRFSVKLIYMTRYEQFREFASLQIII